MNNLNLSLTSPSWLQSVLNNTPDAIMIADRDFHVVKWNQALEELLPQKSDTFAGKNMLDLLHRLCCDKCGISDKLHQMLENGTLEEDILLTRPDGKLLQLSCYMHKLPGTDRLSAIVVIIQGLQKQIQRDDLPGIFNESLYFSYLENSLAPAWISDEDGHALFINDLARQIWKLDDTYRFKHLYELFPEHIAEEFLASDKVVFETNQPIAFVAPSIRKDGSPGFYMLHKFLLPFNTTKRLIAGQAIDITEEINMREELKKSNERFSYVVNAISDCIWDWDLETGKICRSESLMTLTGYSPEDIKDSLDWWEEKIHPQDRKAAMDKIKNFIRRGHSYCDAEYRFRSADNKYRYFTDKGYIVYKDGKPVRAIGVVHDITEQKKLEAKLLRQKIQKQKEITQAVIAAQDHVSNELGKELHDNVSQILSTAKIMLDSFQQKECEDKEDCLKKSEEYILLAINEIRKISKSLNTSRIKEELLGPVDEIVSNLRLSLPVSVNLDFDLVLEKHLSAEQKLMIYRIIQEQTNNIIKYAQASKIVIAVKKKNNSLHLVVQDDGKGFDLKEAKSGIGLTNIRNRVEAFNGSLNIITSSGKGCCIEIMVPLIIRHNGRDK